MRNRRPSPTGATRWLLLPVMLAMTARATIPTTVPDGPCTMEQLSLVEAAADVALLGMMDTAPHCSKCLFRCSRVDAKSDMACDCGPAKAAASASKSHQAAEPATAALSPARRAPAKCEDQPDDALHAISGESPARSAAVTRLNPYARLMAIC